MPDMDQGRVHTLRQDNPDHDYLEKIRRRAYELWEMEGKPEGRHHVHWAQAEHEIKQGQGV